MKKIRPVVFYPSFVLLCLAVILSLVNLETFSSTLSKVTVWSMGFFGSGYELLTVIMFFVAIIAFISPFGRVKIGGSEAKAPFGLFTFFTMSLAMTVATGILFWGALEPIYHVSQPPASLGIAPNSPEAAVFALSTVYMHWTIMPYCIYGVPTVLFAFVYYNMKKPFSIASMLSPILGDDKVNGWVGQLVDSVILFAMVCGVATTLGVGTMMVTGGLNTVFGVPADSKFIWFLVMGGIVSAFVVSALTGLMDGIRKLAQFNFFVILFLLVWVIIFGSTLFNINLGVESIGRFLDNFFSMNLFTGAAAGDQWPVWWTIWYYAIWMAWAPVTAVFLGRISYGFKVRTVIMVNVFFSSLFGIIWFTFFSGTAIHQQLFEQVGGLALVLKEQGDALVTYAFFGGLPLSKIISAVFVFTAFLTFVAGADAMCSTLAGLSTEGINPDNPESSPALKIIWGLLLGGVAYITMAFAGLDGLKALSNLGGIPTLILLVPVTYALVKVMISPCRYDTYKEDYDKYGVPNREIVNPVPDVEPALEAE